MGTGGLLTFAAMMLAAYLTLPTWLFLDWLANGSPYLQDFAKFGIGTALIWFLVFPWPLLAAYAIVVAFLLETTFRFKTRCALCLLAWLGYTVALFFWFVFSVVGG